MPYPAPTNGVGTATQVAVDATSVTLSLAGTATHQIVPSVQDIAGTVDPGTALTLSAVAAASGGATAYTGTITGGAANALVGKEFVVAGFTNGVNNGAFVCTASTATVLTLDNGAGVVETHAGTATGEGSSVVTFVSYNPSQATVSASGLITAVAKGGAVIEVSYPTFGGPIGKVYKEINVLVTA